jgi:hypothetical protein
MKQGSEGLPFGTNFFQQPKMFLEYKKDVLEWTFGI